jgi:hypothetical protein
MFMSKFYTVCHPLGKGGEIAGLLPSLAQSAQKAAAVLAFLEDRFAAGAECKA